MSRGCPSVVLVLLVATAPAVAGLAGSLDAHPRRAPAVTGPPALLVTETGGSLSPQGDPIPVEDARVDTVRSGLEAAETLDSISDVETGTPLDHSLGAVDVAEAWQAEAAGVPQADAGAVPTPDHPSPSAALEALAADTGTSLADEDGQRLGQLDQLPRAVSQGLTDLVDAHLAWLATTEDAFPVTAGTAEDPLSDVLDARAQLLDATADLQAALEAAPARAVADVAPVAAAPAFAIDLGDSDDAYEGDVVLLVDAGGNDTYENNVGGSGVDVACKQPIREPGLGQPVPDAPTRAPRAAAAVDLGGDDRYVSGDDCGVNGGGHFGAGLLVDDGGDDTYRAGDNGTNGGGQAGGIGLLVDTEGDDRYEAGSDGTNGGADTQFGQEGQGGVGLLVDGGGEDTYQAGSSGTNGGGWGFDLVVGGLVDLGGPDAYDAGHFSTNGGGWLGTGFLVDTDGDDRYVAGDDFGTVGVNGGAQLGVGLLVDEAGNDTYVARQHGTFTLAENGGAAGGVALLLDEEGQDRYRDDIVDCTDCTRVPKGQAGAQVDAPFDTAPVPSESVPTAAHLLPHLVEGGGS